MFLTPAYTFIMNFGQRASWWEAWLQGEESTIKVQPSGKIACFPLAFSAQSPADLYLASQTTGIRKQWGLIGKCLEVSFLRHTMDLQTNKKYSPWPEHLPFILKIAWLLTVFHGSTQTLRLKKFCICKAWHCYFGRYFFLIY